MLCQDMARPEGDEGGVFWVGSCCCEWWDLYLNRSSSKLIPSLLILCCWKGVICVRNWPLQWKRRKREFLHIAPLHLHWLLIQKVNDPSASPLNLSVQSVQQSEVEVFSVPLWHTLCVTQEAILLWRCSTTQVLQGREDRARNTAGVLGSAELPHGKPDIRGCRRVASLLWFSSSRRQGVTNRGMF